MFESWTSYTTAQNFRPSYPHTTPSSAGHAYIPLTTPASGSYQSYINFNTPAASYRVSTPAPSSYRVSTPASASYQAYTYNPYSQGGEPFF